MPPKSLVVFFVITYNGYNGVHVSQCCDTYQLFAHKPIGDYVAH